MRRCIVSTLFCVLAACAVLLASFILEKTVAKGYVTDPQTTRYLRSESTGEVSVEPDYSKPIENTPTTDDTSSSSSETASTDSSSSSAVSSGENSTEVSSSASSGTSSAMPGNPIDSSGEESTVPSEEEPAQNRGE